jgi:hypothetical protein
MTAKLKRVGGEHVSTADAMLRSLLLAVCLGLTAAAEVTNKVCAPSFPRTAHLSITVRARRRSASSTSRSVERLPVGS